tara:strand:- start:281 stop:1042 length:762 start_codon:yes stop_codon:yes gene_type:complete
MSETFSSTQGGLTPLISTDQGSLMANDNTTIPSSAPEPEGPKDWTVEELLEYILRGWHDANLGDTNVNGLLNAECLLINKNISIGDSTTSNFSLINVSTTDISSGTDQIISDTNFVDVTDVLVNYITLNPNSKFHMNWQFHYLSSTYYNTMLNCKLFYKVRRTDTGVDFSENFIGEYILGSENTNFTYDTFSKSFYIDICHNAGDTIMFYMRSKIQTDISDICYNILDDSLKPKILKSRKGNTITLAEYSAIK